MTFVNESGMYDVIIRSDSENAKSFRKWVTSEVLPAIRKTSLGFIAATFKFLNIAKNDVLKSKHGKTGGTDQWLMNQSDSQKYPIF